MFLDPVINSDSPTPLVGPADGPGIAYGRSWSNLTFSLSSFIEFFSWLLGCIRDAFASKSEALPLPSRIERECTILNNEIRVMQRKERKGKDISCELVIAISRLQTITNLNNGKSDKMNVRLTTAAGKLDELNNYAKVF